MPRLRHVGLAAALLGAAIPVAVLVSDYFSPGGYWREWIPYVWPTSYMLIATSAIRNAYFLEVAAISAAVNAALYAFLAVMLVALYRRITGRMP